MHEIYNKFNRRIELEYKQCMRTLLPNLKDHKNTEIRAKIILTILKPKKICVMKEKDLLNSSEKKKREELRQSYLKQHTLTQNTI